MFQLHPMQLSWMHGKTTLTNYQHLTDDTNSSRFAGGAAEFHWHRPLKPSQQQPPANDGSFKRWVVYSNNTIDTTSWAKA